jgi:hypothetical protein
MFEGFMFQSRYNVFDAAGQVKIEAGAAIDEAEAVRQGVADLPQGKQLVFDGDTAVLDDAPVALQPNTDEEAGDEPTDTANDGDNGQENPVGSQARAKRRS